MERAGSIAARAMRQQVKADDTREAREEFARRFRALAAAYRHELTDDAIRIYWRVLKDIPLEIRDAGMERHICSWKFFPTVDELLNACADVVDERRKAVSAKATKEIAECSDCGGSGLRTAEGHNAVAPCSCRKRAALMLANVVQPIKRPALPPTDPEVV